MTPTGTPAGQPEQGQASVAASGTTAQAPAQGAGPWANQLASFDEQTRAQVDVFLRTNVQPYITRLEQERAGLQEQARLHQSLNDAPAETYLQITSELFGDEAVDAVINLLAGEEVDEDEVTPPAATAEASRDPEMEAFRQQYLADRQRQAYDAEMARVKTEAQKRIDDAVAAGQQPEDVPVEDRLFHTFVSMADGDFDAAYEGYKQFYGEFRSAVGGTQVTSEEETVTAPATIGATTGTAPTPPIEEKYESIDDALESFFNEQRAQAPPVVGGV